MVKVLIVGTGSGVRKQIVEHLAEKDYSVIERRIINQLDEEENTKDPLEYLVGPPETEQPEPVRPLPAEGFVFSLNGQAYRVMHVNKGKKRLSIEPTCEAAEAIAGGEGANPKQIEGMCLMQYQCQNCDTTETIWNSRPRVTPFAVPCVKCSGTMQHINRAADMYAPDYTPKKGERIFVDFSREAAQMYYFKHVEEHWDSEQYPLSERYETKIEAAKALLGTWKFGRPAIETV